VVGRIEGLIRSPLIPAKAGIQSRLPPRVAWNRQLQYIRLTVVGEITLLDQKKLSLLARGDPGELNVHLSLIEKEIEIQGTKTKAYCHYLPPDANGRIGVARLAEFMRGCAVEYAVPRDKIAQAKARDDKFGQSNSLVTLYEIAKRTFTHLEKSGEGGELLVFLLAERFLKLPQVLCKMDLKTASGVHFHGCDGVYAQIDGDKLILYWGESKSRFRKS
jgi:HamA